MKNFRKILTDNYMFLVLYSLIFLFCVFLLIRFSKYDLHVWSNSHNSSFFDFFFKYITWLGDGVFVIIVGFGMLLFSIRNSILVLSTYIITGIPVQLFKRVLFSGEPRPKLFFEGKYILHVVDGVNLYSVNSFPSGHSASAFALFLCLAIIFKNKIFQAFFFLMACTVAYSRVYLSQHFFLDATVGSFIGVVTTLICYYFILKIDKPWMSKSLIHLISERNKISV